MTPAVKYLNKHKLKYNIHKYNHEATCINYGKEAADKLGLDSKRVFKTLLVELSSEQLAVGVIPVSGTMSLKEIAKALKAKSAKMADKEKVQKTTGYLLGGVSPFGQKKRLKTVLDLSALDYETIYVSGGRRGLDLEVKPEDIVKILGAIVFDIGVSD